MERIPTPRSRAEPVELLLLRALQRSIAGTALASSVVGLTGCGDGEPRYDEQAGPATAEDAGIDAARAATMDAAEPRLDAQIGLDAELPRHDGAAALDGETPGDASGGDGANSFDGASGWPVGEALACPPDARLPVSAERLVPSEPYDYLAVRDVSGTPETGAGSDWVRENFHVVSDTGTPCATATTPACLAQIAKHPESLYPSQCLQICSERSLVTTRGDAVERWASPDELVTLLAPIDSRDEALMLVLSHGYDLACDDASRASAREVADGYEITATRITEDCAPVITTQYLLRVARSGELRVLADRVYSMSSACIGRLPAGLSSESAALGRAALGDQLAACAHLEHASVYAFERLARELSAHGAPRALVAAALGAADDEVRHARVTAALAKQCGGEPVDASVRRLPLRALVEVALENAVEGCVRETYGALVGAYQARHAGDLRVRALMHEVAPDEARHAALSQRVHVWALTQLDEAARGRVYAAQVAAIEALRRECVTSVEPALARALGLPPPAVAEGMVRELSQTLWDDALLAVA